MKRMTNRDARWAQRTLNRLLREIGRSLAVQARDALDMSNELAQQDYDLQRASDALRSR